MNSIQESMDLLDFQLNQIKKEACVFSIFYTETNLLNPLS